VLDAGSIFRATERFRANDLFFVVKRLFFNCAVVGNWQKSGTVTSDAGATAAKSPIRTGYNQALALDDIISNLLIFLRVRT
jgi:hypothetical protein